LYDVKISFSISITPENKSTSFSGFPISLNILKQKNGEIISLTRIMAIVTYVQGCIMLAPIQYIFYCCHHIGYIWYSHRHCDFVFS